MMQKLNLFLLLLSYINFFQPGESFVIQRRLACTKYSRHRCQENVRNKSRRRLLRSRMQPDRNSNDSDNEQDDDDPVEEFLAMEEASRRVTNRLMMPRKIISSVGETIRLFAYAFLIASFALNVSGYAFIKDGDSIRIGTLEEKAFQTEMVKSMKEK